MPEEESQLGLEKIIQLVEGNVDSFKEFIDEEELNREQLKELLRAEQSAKNRKSMIRYLKQELDIEAQHTSNKESEIGVLKAVEYENGEHHLVLDVDGIQLELEHNPLLEFVGNKFEIAHPEEETHHFPGLRNRSGELGFDSVSRPVRPDSSKENILSPRNQGSPSSSSINTEKTSSETNVSENEPEKDQEELRKEMRKENLKQELETEFNVNPEDLREKDFSELKQMKKRLEKRRKLKDRLKNDFDFETEELEDKGIEELEKILDELEELEDKKKELMDSYNVDKTEIDDKNFEELKDLEDRLEKAKEKREELAEKYNINSSQITDKNLAELDDLEEDLKERKELAERLTEYGYTMEELKGKDLEELHNVIDEIKQKERIINELDTEFEDQKLGKISLDELRKLKKEKQEREKLIEELENLGFNTEKLHQCTNQDLRKLKAGTKDSENGEYEELLSKTVEEVKEQVEELDDPDYEKLLNVEKNNKDRKSVKNYLEEKIEQDREEIKEEVQEDIEMLRGAVKEDEEEEDTKSDKIEDIKSQFRESWEKLKNEEDEEKEDRFNEEEVIQKLESYRELERTEAAIKTAQIMKAYLEYQLRIRRELTYKELAYNLENVDESKKYIDTLDNFFRSMEKEEYTGNIQVTNIDKVLDAAEEALRELG